MLNELLRNAAFSAVYRLPMIQRISNIAEEHIQYDSLYFLHKKLKEAFLSEVAGSIFQFSRLHLHRTAEIQ